MHVENKDINSMIELVNVKILTNVDLVPITVPLISDARILMAVFYANLKRLPLRQLPGLSHYKALIGWSYISKF